MPVIKLVSVTCDWYQTTKIYQPLTGTISCKTEHPAAHRAGKPRFLEQVFRFLNVLSFFRF